MNKIEVFEYDGQLYRTKNSALLAEIDSLTHIRNSYYSYIFHGDSTYRNKKRLIELLGELE